MVSILKRSLSPYLIFSIDVLSEVEFDFLDPFIRSPIPFDVLTMAGLMANTYFSCTVVWPILFFSSGLDSAKVSSSSS